MSEEVSNTQSIGFHKRNTLKVIGNVHMIFGPEQFFIKSL